MSLAMEEQARLLKALCDERVLGHPIPKLQLLETHISYVILTGVYAYKIKKAVDLEFLNFRSLENRKKFCFEELRLNRRTAPDLYLDVLCIGGTVQTPMLGVEPAIEYALKMREFPQEDLAANALAQGRIDAGHWNRLAEDLVRFHAQAEVADQDSAFGLPKQIRQSALQNFRQLDQVAPAGYALRERQRLEEWTRSTYLKLESVLATRRRNGRVRECHGDLHLGNLVLADDRLTPFDCIEFNPSLRWIDVMDDVAFLTMDLDHRGAGFTASLLLNRYLEISGDYPGLEVLRFYQVYRALVRAKVALIRAKQAAEDVPRPDRDFEQYIALAIKYLESPRPVLLITHGLSGSGKTAFSEGLVGIMGAVRVRSDVERKRLQGLNALARTHASMAGGLYDSRVTETTYEKLHQLAQLAIRSGYTAIVDAAFLSRAQRRMFQRLANECDVPFLILDFRAPPEVLRERLLDRERKDSDASDATLKVLEFQLRTQEPLAEDEKSVTYPVDTQVPLVEAFRLNVWQGLLDRLAVDQTRS